MLRIKNIIVVVLFFCGKIFSQENLSLEQAIQIALKNNFSILIAKNNSDISSNDVTYGNAGMLPQVGLSAAGTKASNNTHQNYTSGLEVNKSGVGSTNISSGVSLNWTLFDGLRMFATYDKLKELKAMGELNLKIEIENDISKVINAYYDVVRQKQLIKATSDAISIYEERQKIAEAKYSIGAGSKLEVLQAKVDLNSQKSQLFKLQTALFNVKASLNQLLARTPETDFMTADS
ncbi:MAG TPA: TolC family protein, partial [Bacteroidia bacterium]